MSALTAPDRAQSAPEDSGLLFTLPAKAENVAVVRHAIGGLAETLGMDPIAVSDLKTIVTEACTNVAVHAYADGDGPLEVEVSPDEDGLTVTVRDQGSGIRPAPDLDQSRLRLGLPLIAALCEQLLDQRWPRTGHRGGDADGACCADRGRARRWRADARERPGHVDQRQRREGHRPRPRPRPRRACGPHRVSGRPPHRHDAARRRTGGQCGRRLRRRSRRMLLEDGDGTIDLQVGPMRKGAAAAACARTSRSRASGRPWRSWPTKSGSSRGRAGSTSASRCAPRAPALSAA